MKLRLILTALVFGLTPAISLACAAHDQKQAMSCADGTTYDTTAGTCVPQTTG